MNRPALLLPLALAWTGCSEPTLTVTNDPPVVVIQRPGDAAVFAEGEAIAFLGKVADDGPIDQVTATWLDNGSIPLGTPGAPDGEGFVTFTIADLAPGTHAISLRAVDLANLSAEASVTIEITDIADEPNLTVVQPTAGSHTNVGALTLFQAMVSDGKDLPTDLLVDVVSDIDGFLCDLTVDSLGDGACDAILTTPGNHRLNFTVTDTDGYTRSKTVIVVADPVSQLPTITSVSPASGSRVRQSYPIQFQADVNDPQDPAGALIATLTSDVDGQLCQVNVDSQGHGTCFGTLATLGNHILSYDVVDTDGNHGSANLLVVVADGRDIDDDNDGFTENQGDCDDGNQFVYPMAPEQPNHIDDDCDNTVDEGTVLYDDDGDGYCESVSIACSDGSTNGDCDDATPYANPGLAESCGDGVDNNCNRQTDEVNAQGCTTFYLDTDGDLYGDPATAVCACSAPPLGVSRGLDCNDAVAGINPTAVEIPDGIDQNCDGLLDEGTNRYDNDGDGYCAAAVCTAQPGQAAPLGADCNDNNPAIAPNKTEICGNGYDDNCNNLSDEGQNAVGCFQYYRDDDNDGFGSGAGQCLCAASGPYVRTNNQDCYDSNPEVKPGQSLWFNTDRGDGSYDYDCRNGSEQKFTNSVDCGCPASTFDSEPFREGWDGVPACGQFGAWATSCTYLTAQFPNPWYPILGGPYITECIDDDPATVVGKQQLCH